jgi:ATP-binding cassette subfamily F protein 3
MIIDLQNISHFFGSNEILTNISLKIEDDDRLGLIGANGAGKSTLLNIIAGEIEASEGEIARGKKTVGYLRQDSGLSGNLSIIEEARSVFSEIIKTGEKLSALYNEISSVTDHSSQKYKELSAEYSRLQTVYEQKDGYNIDVKINTVLYGMGFREKDRNTPVSTLSGGEKTRLALCRLLLSGPDLLILDEPTNHLDFKTLSWLEDYLKTYRGALLMVSHDRYFLDKLTKGICEIYKGKLSRFKGNYSDFTARKASYIETVTKEYEKQQAQIASLKEYVDRNRARASTAKSAQSRQNTLDKMEIMDKPSDYLKRVKLRFDFDIDPVNDILDVDALKLEIGGNTLNESVSIHVTRGEKIAIVGENGIGKTTFLKRILEKYNTAVTWGRNVKISYFEQEKSSGFPLSVDKTKIRLAGDLNDEKTALNEIWDRFPSEYERDIRGILGKMLITGDDVYKKVGVLSGGERAKVKFAIMLLERANVLILDEPTNHLDLSSKEILDKALCDYKGTVIMVSHDRYLLNRAPTKIVEMKNNEITVYDGKYDYYVSSALSPEKTKTVTEKSVDNGYFRSKKERADLVKRLNNLKKTETAISLLEEEIEKLETEISSPETASDFEVLTAKCAELDEKRRKLDKVYEIWEELQ